MIKIPLTKGQVAFVDDEFAHLLNWKWCALKSDTSYYAVRAFRPEPNKKSLLRMHHCIVGFPLNNNEVDHIDGNGLNNQRNNLRIVTHRKNGQNRKELRLNTKSSTYTGVTWNSTKQRYIAQISIGKKRIHIGTFINEEDAHKAYLKAVQDVG
jgi:hypothetical protein